MNDSSPRRIEVAPRSAEAFFVDAGATVRIVDVAGGQPGDLVAFNRHDPTEKFSQARTRVENHSHRITAGHALWSNAQPPRVMLTIVRDTYGAHDLLYSPCCRYALEKRFGVSREGCFEHLAEALAPHGIAPRDLPDPLSLFFNVLVEPSGEIALGRHGSKPGDCIELRAEMDCLVAVSTCSVPLPGRRNSPYNIEVTG